MNLPALGIDVSKRTCHFHFLLDSQQSSRSAVFANSPRGWQRLHRWLQACQPGPLHVCLEATGVYGEGLARFLHGLGHYVSIVNPARIHAYARAELKRHKTDALDAGVIARFCYAQRPPRWEPLAEPSQQLQDLVRHLEALQQRHREERNRLENLARRTPEVLRSVRKLIRQLQREIVQFQKRIATHLRAHSELCRQHQLLVSIPGIGDWTALRLLAEIPHLHSFRNVRSVVAYAGLHPALRESGSSLHGPHRLSKVGNAQVRVLLYLPALVALRHNPLLRDLRQRLRARQKHHRLILGAAMRKLLHLAYGVLKSGLPFDPSYRATSSHGVLAPSFS